VAKRNRKRYTDEERATLVAMLEAQDYPNVKGALAYVANYAKVPESTLRGWFKARRNPPPAKLRDIKKRELADVFEDVAYDMLGHAGDPEIIAEMSGKDAVIAAATATDKMRLLRGLPTEIVEILPTIRDIYDALQERGKSPDMFFDRIKQRILDDSQRVQ
jgi:hypothetical protein